MFVDYNAAAMATQRMIATSHDWQREAGELDSASEAFVAPFSRSDCPESKVYARWPPS